MAASSLQPAGSALLLIHPVPVSDYGVRVDGSPSGIARQELLWRELFLDPPLWWDSRKQKEAFNSPEFRHTESKAVLRVNTLDKPAWVDAQLGALDKQATSTFDSNLLIKAKHVTAETVTELCDKGQVKQAVDTLSILVQTDFRVSSSLFYSVLKRCMAQKDLVQGQRVHGLVIQAGYESNTFLGNHVLRMYASQGRLQQATDVFTRVAEPDAFMWSSMISAHAKHGEAKQAIQLYHQMRCSSVAPDCHVFVAALQACAQAADLESGKKVHTDVLESSVQPNLFVWTCVVDMYAKCGRLEDARRVFDSLTTRDVVTWTTMIDGYAEHEQGQEALVLYEKMERQGIILANGVTFCCLLKACARVGALQQGKLLHSQILKRGLESDIFVGNGLINMYAKCGRLEEARKVFDSLPTRDVVTWNAMIGGYAEHEQSQEALSLYENMEQQGMIVADLVTYSCLLKACAGAGALEKGKQLHSQIRERGLEPDITVGNCLVSLYAKCERLEDARTVFDSLPNRDVVTWNTMIAGYAEHNHGQEGMSLYKKMEQEGMVVADPITFACLLKACAGVGALAQGKQLHSQIVERGLGSDIFVGNCLVHMYAECGRLEDARRVFDGLPAKDVVTWNTMISGFGRSSEAHKAIECFKEMTRDDVQPNATTFTCLLAACSQEGLVKEGRQFFKGMEAEWGIMPTTDLFTCMVDLLGRAGCLDEAERMLLSAGSNDVGFMSLLTACRSHGDIERGVRCFDTLIKSDSQNAAAFVLMGNIYADAGRWSDVERIERLRKVAGAGKKPAVAGIEVDRHVHTFVVGEEKGDISSKVKSMNVRLKEDGSHLPHTELVLKRVSEKEKEDGLCGHAEKLALAYGLLNTPDGSPLLVTKTLRMCGDCHRSTEIMSRIEQREIVVRDAHRVHRFVHGSCRCAGRP